MNGAFGKPAVQHETLDAAGLSKIGLRWNKVRVFAPVPTAIEHGNTPIAGHGQVGHFNHKSPSPD